MLSSDEISEIIPTRVSIVSPDGLITREWFLFLCDLYLSTASLSGSVNDIALLSSPDISAAEQLGAGLQDMPSMGYDVLNRVGELELSFVPCDDTPTRQVIGASSSSVEQLAISTSTIYTIGFENVQLSVGVDMQADNVTILSPGTYQIDYRLRINDVGDIMTWIEVNDVPVSDSLVDEIVVVMVANISNCSIIQLNSGDVVKVKWSSTSTNQTLKPLAPTTTRPSAPSAKLEIRKI